MIYASVFAVIFALLALLSAPFKLDGVYFFNRKNELFRAQITLLGIVVGNISARHKGIGYEILLNGKKIKKTPRVDKAIKQISMQNIYRSILNTNIALSNDITFTRAEDSAYYSSIFSVCGRIFQLLFMRENDRFDFNINAFSVTDDNNEGLSGNASLKISVFDIIVALATYGKNK